MTATTDLPKSWPFQEAASLLDRFSAGPPAKGHVLFETGYGPSGLPHIGTFGEVVRTTMVRRAFARLSDLPTRLFAFSDDMDGLRKVPDNLPNADMLARHLGKPLTRIPDPFGTHESFGHHNNARLRAFLDRFGFDYEFQSASDWYRSGRFDATLRLFLAEHETVRRIILPTLGPERRATYSPFLPICPRSGRVLQVAIDATDVAAGTVAYRDPDDGRLVEVPVTGGHCKLQWKADWAMRWLALQVDYEMSGKDLIPSVDLSSRIVRALGGVPPVNLTYELFLDEQGEKISKSKGNGLSVDEWLSFAPADSLSLFMYQQPKRAKRLFFDVIPKTVDEYLMHLRKFPDQSEGERRDNPVWHIHDGQPPDASDLPVDFSLLLNLASVVHGEDPGILWGFLERYRPGCRSDASNLLRQMVDRAVAYARDFVAPTKRYRAPTPDEAAGRPRARARSARLGRRRRGDPDAGL
jgi:lysyl-tRNA synthetase class 1